MLSSMLLAPLLIQAIQPISVAATVGMAAPLFIGLAIYFASGATPVVPAFETGGPTLDGKHGPAVPPVHPLDGEDIHAAL